MYSLKKLAGQTAVYGLSSIIGRFLNYLLTPLYTYQFIAKDYGVVTEMYAYVAFLLVLLTYGMETAFFRFSSKSDNPDKIYGNALLPIIGTSAIFAMICIFFSNSIASIIRYPDNPEFVVWFAIIVAFDAITSIPLARLRQQNKPAKFAFINLSGIAVNIGLNLFFIAYCKVEFDQGNSNWIIETFYRPEVGVAYIFIANLISSIFKGLLLLPSMLKVKLELDRTLLKSMIIYAFPLLIAGLAGIANENIDRILLKYLLLKDLGIEATMTQVGIYGACYKVSILITLFVQAYRYAAEPFFFKHSDQQDAKETYARLMKYFIIVCLLIFLGLMLNIDTVMLFVGEEYRIGVEVVPILLMANIFLGIYYNLSIWYKLTDKTIYGAYIAIGGAFVTIAGNVILIPILGYKGSAWATFICYVTMVISAYFIGRKYYFIPYPLLRLIGYFVLTIGIYATVNGFNWENRTIEIISKNGILLGLAAFLYILERPKKLII